MIASDLQVSLPTVNRRTPAFVAARLVARGTAALVLADDDGGPAAILAPPDVLRLVVAAEHRSEVPTVGDLLDDDGARIGPVVRVEPSAPLAEVAARMADARALIAVVDADPRAPRFVLLHLVLDAILASREDD